MIGQEGQRSWTIHIRKDNLKFSAAHMTVFADGRKEGLHGHNYQVELTVELQDSPALARMLSYEVFKKALRSVCEQWDEKVLIAGENPWLEPLPAETGEYACRLCGKRYVLPADEVMVLHHGRVVEQGPRDAIFTPPHADYTARLLASASMEGRRSRARPWCRLPASTRPSRSSS